MAVRTRDNVPLLAAVLSVVSLALVFGAVLGAIPSSRLPHFPALVAAIPHLNAAISVAAITTIAVGWRAIRSGQVARHRAAMLSAAGSFATFLLLYLYKVVVEGTAPFPGPEQVYQFVYLPLLAVHMTLAVVCVPLLYYVLLIGLTHSVAEIPRTNHPRVGRVAATLWLTSFALGFVVYLLLYVVY
jgi:putative membrane protein